MGNTATKSKKGYPLVSTLVLWDSHLKDVHSTL